MRVLGFVVLLVIAHAVGGLALAGNWFWIRTGVVIIVWLLGVNVRAGDGGDR